MHPIVRAAIYEDIPPLDRPDHHARAALLLAERRCSPQAVAAQLLESAPAGEEWVVDALREASALALALGDSEGGGHLPHARAGRAAPRRAPPALLAELGRAEARTGAPAAVEHLEQAIALAPDPREAAEAALELAGPAEVRGRLRARGRGARARPRRGSATPSPSCSTASRWS